MGAASVAPMGVLIDNLQDCTFSEKVFRQLRAGGVDAIHVTVAHHETFREMVLNLERWNHWFEQFPDLILRGTDAGHVSKAQATGRTAVFFGAQSPSCIETDIGLVEILHQLGLRFMQLSHDSQSLLASGCCEDEDTGLTRMGRQVVAEMNRVGLVVDMSHSAERSALEAIEHSTRPIAITHANPHWWHPALRNRSDTVLKALTNSGGMLGFSIHPQQLKDGTNCRLSEFCEMIAEAADRYGAENLGFGTNLSQGQPDRGSQWMRVRRWSTQGDYAEATRKLDTAPQPDWFHDNRDWDNLRDGLREVGFSRAETEGIMGDNWLRFYTASFRPA